MSLKSKLASLEGSLPAASGELARHLAKGELAIFAGAGLSVGFNLPRWWELVKQCLDELGISSDGIDDATPFDMLKSKAEIIESRCGSTNKFHNLVSKALYQKYVSKSSLDAPALLRALGAMLMGSHRGHVTDVLTLNFDSLLEAFLKDHGFIAKPITSLPALFGKADANIYHLNGYLPFDPKHGKNSDFLIFSQHAFDKRLSEKNSLWKDLARHILLSKVVLVVGMSLGDEALRVQITDAHDALGESRPVAFWMLGPDTSEDTKSMLRGRGCVPLVFSSFDEYAPFLLQICQKAADIASC